MKAFRILIPIAILALLAVFYFFYPFSLPSGEEEAERLQDVTKVTLMEGGKNIGGRIIYDEVVIESPEAIDDFIKMIQFGPKAEGCRCIYSRFIKFSTPAAEVNVTLGPHHFWVNHRRNRVNLFRTPPVFFAAFERHFGREPEDYRSEQECPAEPSSATAPEGR